MISRRRNRRSGFTFLEIMLVVVIIGILVALVGPKLVGRTQQARVTASTAQLSSINQSIKSFEMDTGGFPKTLKDLVESSSENEKDWRGPYMDSDAIPKDSWGEEYDYKFPGNNNRKGYDLWSKGPDKQADTEDDITNWTKKE